MRYLKINNKKLDIYKVMVTILAFLILVSACYIIKRNFFTASEYEPKVIQKNNKEDAGTTLVAFGDNIIHETVYNYADKQKGTAGDNLYDFKPCYENIKDYVQNSDLAYISQETIVNGDNEPVSGYPAFNSPSCIPSDLANTGFNVVSGATNHAMDMSSDGILQTANIWRQQTNLTYLGTYDSQEDRNNIRVVEKDGIKFAFLAYTFGVNQYSNYSTIQKEMANRPYMVPLFDEATVTNDVQAAKQISDVVIVAAHWGLEGDYELNGLQTKYSQLLANLGVDVVLGSHTHLVQSVQWVNGIDGNKTLVAYGLGNIISSMTGVDNQLEMMLSMTFTKKDNYVSIKDVTIMPLVNHYNNDVCTVYPLKDYNDNLASNHSILVNQPNIIQSFKDKINSIIDANQFTIDM